MTLGRPAHMQLRFQLLIDEFPSMLQNRAQHRTRTTPQAIVPPLTITINQALIVTLTHNVTTVGNTFTVQTKAYLFC